MSELTIRTMKKNELAIALSWANDEGWNPGINDAQLFYNADPNGFFVAEIENEIVAVGSAVNYDNTFSFCGLYIVAPQHRAKGYGLALTKHRLQYCAKRNIGIDGVLENVEIYQRIGYKPYFKNKRYQTVAQSILEYSENIEVISHNNLKQIFDYDRQCFPAARNNFLRAWLFQRDGKAICYCKNGNILGYAVRRRCQQGYKVGPLFADNLAVASALMNELQRDIHGEQIILDTPENNPEATQLANLFTMEVVFETMRMYQKGLPNIANDKIFGITTFELG